MENYIKKKKKKQWKWSIYWFNHSYNALIHTHKHSPNNNHLPRNMLIVIKSFFYRIYINILSFSKRSFFFFFLTYYTNHKKERKKSKNIKLYFYFFFSFFLALYYYI
jgi:hypothetical protein